MKYKLRGGNQMFDERKYDRKLICCRKKVLSVFDTESL